ncbi:MAG TPA: hypothetical protein VKR54_02395 [Candidatus Babeliales bacterium]|jgi:hypothetical protein|nr:hypothetical protein [Candidatus Babeliales bacterium]
MTCRKKVAFLITFLSLALTNNALRAMNIVNSMWPYDTSIRPTFNNKRAWQLAFYTEGGYHNAKGFTEDGDIVNPLRIWNAQQNALAMLEGFPEDSPITQLRSELLDSDNGIRGRFNVCGDFQMNFSTAFAARYFFANDWSIGLYLPVYQMKLKNVNFQDLTPNLDYLDKLVHTLLTDNLAANVQQLGDLCIGDWKRDGVGDLTLLIEWFRDFYQNKDFLKCVRVNWRAGLGFPTGLRENPNLIFAVPFGWDGAVSMPFGLGIDLTLGTNFKTGVDVQLTQIFGHTRCRRIKTDVAQTELLLLQTATAYRDSGLIQRFNLYVELFQFCKGLSFSVYYQYLKRGEDEISLKTENFSNNVANTSPRLEIFTMHHMIPKFTYDFGVHCPDARTRPELNIYARIPVNGRNVALVPMIGAIFSVDF